MLIEPVNKINNRACSFFLFRRLLQSMMYELSHQCIPFCFTRFIRELWGWTTPVFMQTFLLFSVKCEQVFPPCRIPTDVLVYLLLWMLVRSHWPVVLAEVFSSDHSFGSARQECGLAKMERGLANIKVSWQKCNVNVYTAKCEGSWAWWHSQFYKSVNLRLFLFF